MNIEFSNLSEASGDGSDLDYEDYLKFVSNEDMDLDKPVPSIEYEPKVDKFILDAPEGMKYYFRDYEGAEDFWSLNFKEDINLDA
jgi:hypothetical protein